MIDLTPRSPGNLNTLIDAAISSSLNSNAIMNKVESALQTSVARVTWRNDDCSAFEVTFGKEDIGKPAVLAYEKGFYTLLGMPKFDELVIVMHNNGNNVHILFPVNDKDWENPPNKIVTTFSISSSKSSQ